jgi:hypothetical protein
MVGARRGLTRLVIAGVLLASRGPTNALHVGDRISRLEAAETAWDVLDLKFGDRRDSMGGSSWLPAATPPMGWNSWYALGGESGWARTNEATIRETADALRETGLAAAGYRCAVRVQGCVPSRSSGRTLPRIPRTHRACAQMCMGTFAHVHARSLRSRVLGRMAECAVLVAKLTLSPANSTLVVDDSWASEVREEGLGLQAHSGKFPGGMKGLSRYIRSRGLELGLYTTSGNFTCAGEVGSNGSRHRGSWGHQREDVDLWIREWGVTYVKHCLCNTTAEIRRAAFPVMRRAIDAAQMPRMSAPVRPGARETDALQMPQAPRVVYECANYPDRPWEGEHFEGCNVWRISADVPDSFQGWTAVVDRAVTDGVNRRAGTHGAGGQGKRWGGGWSSLDYLRIREGGGQTLEQYRAQMSMWAVLGAPLFIGVDVRALSEAALAIYKNADVIAVSQDRAGIVGYRLYQARILKSTLYTVFLL